MVNFINDYLLDFSAVYPLDVTNRPRTKEIRGNIRAYHKDLAQNGEYSLKSAVKLPNVLSVSPLFGLGASGNELNQVIEDLFLQVQKKLVICTPYFNFPRTLQHKIATLLENGKRVEIIVGDKVANDFYIPPEQPFKMAGHYLIFMKVIFAVSVKNLRLKLKMVSLWCVYGVMAIIPTT